jgi:hypothetical protein
MLVDDPVRNPTGSRRINNGGSTCYATSSPAIDPRRQFVYSYGLDGKVHKYAVGSGNEVLTGGWPETTTLKGFDEKGSAALSIATAGVVRLGRLGARLESGRDERGR